MKSTLGTALGAGLASVPLMKGMAETPDHLESRDIDGLVLAKGDYDLHFVAIGDWGRNGADHQREVAI